MTANESAAELANHVVAAVLSGSLLVGFSLQIAASVKRDRLQDRIKAAERLHSYRTGFRAFKNPFPPTSPSVRRLQIVGIFTATLLCIRCVDPLGRSIFDPRWLHWLSFLTAAMIIAISCAGLETVLILATAFDRLRGTFSESSQLIIRLIGLLTILSSSAAGLAYGLLPVHDTKWATVGFEISLAVLAISLLAVWHYNFYLIFRAVKAPFATLGPSASQRMPPRTQETPEPSQSQLASASLQQSESGQNIQLVPPRSRQGSVVDDDEAPSFGSKRSRSFFSMNRAIESSMRHLLITTLFATVAFCIGIGFLFYDGIRNILRDTTGEDPEEIVRYRFPSDYAFVYVQIAAPAIALFHSWQNRTKKLLSTRIDSIIEAGAPLTSPRGSGASGPNTRKTSITFGQGQGHHSSESGQFDRPPPSPLPPAPSGDATSSESHEPV